MDTEILEQQAMNKIYNSGEPDELHDVKEELPREKSKFSLVPSILRRHGENLVLEIPFYTNDFSYLVVKDTPWQWHLLKFFNSTYGMVLPIDYIIEYTSVNKNSKNSGIISFKKEKEYTLEYRKVTLEEFYNQMKELSEIFSLLENFTTENNQIFYEYKEDAIYMYQDGYVWKVTGYSRNNITEYYEMYLLLMSLRLLKGGKYLDNSNLKFVYLVLKNAVQYLYKGIDLRKKNIDYISSEFQKNLDVVTISLDNNLYKEVLDLDYSVSKRRRSHEKEEESEIIITHKDKWFFDGKLSLGLFGTYSRGELFEFPSILSSNELSEPEKKELIKKVVVEKKQECIEKRSYLDNQFLLLFFQKRVGNARELFEKENWLDFLKLENITLEELSNEMIKEWFLEKIKFLEGTNVEESEEWEEFCTYIDYSSLKAKVIPLYLTITPLFMVLEYAIFGQKENFILTEDCRAIEWV